jgi:glycosyltransferase involved in cell wall biosynthesis
MKGGLMDNISVIIRNRNEEQYIGFAIQSVINNFINPEIIIVDNNSNDSSLEIISLFRPSLKE